MGYPVASDLSRYLIVTRHDGSTLSSDGYYIPGEILTISLSYVNTANFIFQVDGGGQFTNTGTMTAVCDNTRIANVDYTNGANLITPSSGQISMFVSWSEGYGQVYSTSDSMFVLSPTTNEPSIEPSISVEPSISMEPSVEPFMILSMEPTSVSTNVVSTASIQIVTYASSTTCSGPITGANTYATDICVPVGIPSGSSSILTKTGNVVNAQSYVDTACQTTAESLIIQLDTCSIQDGSAIILFADAPNTIRPAPFISLPDQVTMIYA